MDRGCTYKLMNKICYKCHGKMIEREIEITSGWGEYELEIKGVKAFVCEECGENERPDYLNVEETADLLRVSTQTVYNMIKSGRLKGTKFGREWRFLRKNIESLIQPQHAIAARNTSTQNYEEDSSILNEIRKKRNTHE